MRFRSPKRSLPLTFQLNLASMIDIVFLLLIFFIVTTSLALPESRLSPALQKNDRETSTLDYTPQVIRVSTANGRNLYRLGSRVIEDRAELTAVLRELQRDLGIFVQVDDSASVEAAATAIQCCRDAGFEKVTYVPEPSDN